MKQVISYTVICLLACATLVAEAQPNINKAEYFFDTDPGFGNGTAITVSPSTVISNLAFNANTASLPNGMHTLYVRSRNAQGRWSTTNYLFIAKVQNPYTNVYPTPNINKAEYFFDTDPGLGNGTNITLSASTNISSLVFNANVSSLHNGMHTLYVRSRNVNGGWSTTSSLVIAKVQSPYASPYTAGNVVKAEYFYDTDPGFGSGTDIPLTASADISGMVFNASVSGLHRGVHTLYVRTKDAQGRWTITSMTNFVKVQGLYSNPYTAGNVVKMEYFFDTDPGIGSGIDIPVTAASDINGLTVNLPISSLSNTLHTLYIRTKDAQGRWSITAMSQFSKIQGPASAAYAAYKINKAEYFFDADPGLGNATDIPLTPAMDVSGLAFSANTAPLHNGVHTLFVRTRDSIGQWSISNTHTFVKVQDLYASPYSLVNINKAEYFIDTDPGLGNGTSIPLSSGQTIPNLAVSVNVASLSGGLHTLFIRTRDGAGKWSITNSSNFVKVQSPYSNPYTAGNINKLEYYFDTDPGFGSGINIPVTAGADINGLVFNANVSSLHSGVHSLYVRSRDNQGRWSIVNKVDFARVQTLYSNPNTASNLTRIEFFVDTDPGLGAGVPVSFTASQNVSSAAFNVDMTVLVNGNHTLFVRSRDAQGKWSISNIHSFVGGTAPLAIRLLSFEARLNPDKTVDLEWITEMEKDVASYKIERSPDAISWELVGEQKPLSANSSEKHSYQMTDADPGTGIVYYRLTETDLNGNKTLAPVRFVTITEGQAIASELFPNPTDGKSLNIRSEMFVNEDVTITVAGADGRIYLRMAVAKGNNKLFSLSDLNLAAGSYFVNLQSAGKSESLKFQVGSSGN